MFTLTGSGFSPDLKLTGPQGVTFSAISVSPDGTTITATIAVATTAPAGTGRALTVKDGPLGNYGSTVYNGLTVS